VAAKTQEINAPKQVKHDMLQIVRHNPGAQIVNEELSLRYQKIQDVMAHVSGQNRRQLNSVHLVAVSKGQSLEVVQQALSLGIRCFGENRVQEAQGKFADLRLKVPDLQLHLIGPLQSNKVKAALALFDTIETLDRPELAHALAKAMATTARRPRLLVQVNIGAEAQKSGVAPEQLSDLLATCRELGLVIAGLMCIPPVDHDPALHFAKLAQLARAHGLSELSMGMSADYPQAIAAGATYIRVGSALFGPRGG
jgi:pyridoxal phosphate enzyme (YggS family)